MSILEVSLTEKLNCCFNRFFKALQKNIMNHKHTLRRIKNNPTSKTV